MASVLLQLIETEGTQIRFKCNDGTVHEGYNQFCLTDNGRFGAIIDPTSHPGRYNVLISLKQNSLESIQELPLYPEESLENPMTGDFLPEQPEEAPFKWITHVEQVSSSE